MKQTRYLLTAVLGFFLLAGVLWSQDQQGEGVADSAKPEELEKSGREVEPKPEAEPERKAEKRVFGKSTEASYAGKVVVIKVGMDELSSMPRYKFIRRTVKRAEKEGAAAIVFDLNTPGGFAWETSEFLMQDLARAKTKTIAYVNPLRPWCQENQTPYQ